MKIKSEGFAQPGFETLEVTFEEILNEFPDSGSALSIWHEGKNVVDLRGGFLNPIIKDPWSDGHMSVIFSCTKGLMALALAKLYEEGRFDYDDLVTKHWPEFGQAGKHEITIQDLVSHRAGIPFFIDDVTFDQVLNWKMMISKVENEKPLWNPGDFYAYHALTFGWLTGELIRRVSGKMPGEYLKEEISKPLGAHTWLGIPREKEALVATSYVRDELVTFFTDLEKFSTDAVNFLIRSLTLGSAFPVTLVGDGIGFNSPLVHQAQIPGAGGISTANGLAKIWSSVVVSTQGVRLLSDKTVDFVTQVQSEGKPFTNLDPPYSRFGMGFQLDSPARRYFSENSFGHDGAGGQCAFADSKHKLGFAYLTNEMGGGTIEDGRATRLISELQRVLLS